MPALLKQQNKNNMCKAKDRKTMKTFYGICFLKKYSNVSSHKLMFKR